MFFPSGTTKVAILCNLAANGYDPAKPGKDYPVKLSLQMFHFLVLYFFFEKNYHLHYSIMRAII